MNEEKGLLGSVTIWGLITAVGAPLLASFLGGDADVINEELSNVISAGATFVGSVLVIWGRWKARAKITKII